MFAVCVSIVVFALLYAIQINTPLLSDDYIYMRFGGHPDLLTRHYLSWSGRLAADITSSTILSSLPKTVYAALNSLALVILLWLCVRLPSFVCKEKLSTIDSATFCIIFIMYWIASPNIRDTTFWMVGAANYVWTNLYILMFICIFSFAMKKHFKYRYVPIVFLCALIGGVTNENTGWVTCAYVALCYLHNRSNENVKRFFYIYAAGFCGGLAGWLTLILSPGNSIRAALYPHWYSMSIFQRIDIHIYDRFPVAISNYSFVFITMILFFAIKMLRSSTFVMATRVLQSEDSIVHCESEAFVRKMFLFFICCGFVSMLMMVGAPEVLPRSGNGALVFFLIALSCMIYILNKVDFSYLTSLIQYVVIASLGILYFIPSYYLVYFSQQRVAYQDEIRGILLDKAVRDGADVVSIPDFHYPRKLKKVMLFTLTMMVSRWRNIMEGS
ncbi:MAG: DUF6056 family protein [Aeromonas sp.]